jgi:hypothetical protein
VLHNFASLIAHSPIAGLHQGITCSILRTDVTVDTCPACVAFTSVTFARRSIETAGKRAAYYNTLSAPCECIPVGLREVRYGHG